MAGAALVLVGLSKHHPFARFGAANQVTVTRGALVALLAGLIGERTAVGLPTFVMAAAVTVAVLDGIDGWMARRNHMASDFGARFDMETDALFIMVLAVLAWQYGKVRSVGAAVGTAALRVRRCGHGRGLAASSTAPQQEKKSHCGRPGRRPHPHPCALCSGHDNSRGGRARIVRADAVLSGGCHVVAAERGAVPGHGFTAVNFNTGMQRSRVLQGVWLFLAVLLLNASVTFHNVWPTLGVHWPGELSVEFGVLLLGLAVSNAWLGPTRRGVLVLLSALIVLFALGRYAYVTVQALYGRDINLYWDGPQFASVIGMFVRVASVWAVAGVFVGSLLVLGLLYLIARWSLGQIDTALRLYRPARLGFGAGRGGAGGVLCRPAKQRCDAASAALFDPGNPDLCRAGRCGSPDAISGQREPRVAAFAGHGFELFRAGRQ